MTGDGASRVPWIRPRYLWEDVDRHGNVRRYVARPKAATKIRIHPDPTAEAERFWDAYRLALEGVALPRDPAAARLVPALEPAVTGTLRWLVERYQGSAEFLALGATTRSTRRNILASCLREPIEPGSPHLMDRIPLAKMTPAHVRMLRDRKRALPDGANGRLKAIRGVFKWALEQDELVRRFGIAGNPARDVPAFKTHGDGYHTWTTEEVSQYERRHPVGTTARLALALLLFTGQRRSDVVRFGRQHIKGGVLRFTQQKNRTRKAVTLDLPVLDCLRAAIAAGPCGDLTFIVTHRGLPFTDAGFGNRMRAWCDEAGLPHCSAHGLRKAGACIAAENGATEAQMMAIFGWSDPKMAARYARKARQKKIAGASMHLIISREPKPEPSLPLLDWSESGGRIA